VEREVYVVRSSTGCEDQPCSWVRREGRKREERKREYLIAKSADRTACFHLIYYKAQFCGCSPSERMNHVHLVVVCDRCCVLFLYDILLLH
jgi:hypothetical protein